MIDSFSGEYRWLSNFWPAQVELDGRLYPTVENAYQAAKTLSIAERLPFEGYSPGEAKRKGRRLAVRSDWEEVKLWIMEYLVVQKFLRTGLRELLRATGDQPIVEGNHWGDTFWGVCNGVGENHLGKLIMKIRMEV